MAALIERFAPLAQKLGFGGIMGYISGLTLKRLGQEAAFLVGVAFLGLQGLQYGGYIKIDYSKVQAEVTKKLDVDGDGKLTSKDALAIWGKVKNVLSDQLPGAGGFSAGFALGIYYGK
jgi:FUN14 domain-containing protein 1